ncbi:aminopeptidase YpdF [Peptococcaceae bacterium CEB3]|nr:aminopeptidase YpdF [Peptococcaceae bacterium CEB3]
MELVTQRRLDKMRKRMEIEGLEGFVIVRPENLRYLSGFSGGEGTVFILPDRAYLLTDFRYIEQVAGEAPGFEIVRVAADPFAPLTDLGQGTKRVGFEGDFVTHDAYLKLAEHLPLSELVSRPEVINDLRAVKDEEEISRIRRAVRAADQAFDVILTKLAVGQKEEEISLELEFAMRRAGASGRSFDFIVASGPRGALPHGTASSKRVEKGEFLTFDFGAVLAGYCSDITRTVVFGEPDEKQREIYEVVLKAQLAGIRAVKPGVTGREVDAVARGIIAEAGYGEYFGHGLGHSVGLAIHEGPNLNMREERLLQPGNVVTVEPGIYIPGWGGVRIEDMVVVTEEGCEILTQAPKDLIIIQ